MPRRAGREGPSYAGRTDFSRSGRRIRRMRDQRGQSLVEFAISAMLFFLMLFGIVEIGIVVWRYNMVSDLAQEGARRAIVCGGGTLLPSCDIEAYVQSRSPFTLESVTTTPADLSSLMIGDTVAVEVTATGTTWDRLLPSGTISLTSTAQMIVAR